MSKIIDCVSYNGEAELFEIRYNILKDYVDEFRVVEFDKTFSGKPKSRLFPSVAWLSIRNTGKVVKHYLVTEDIWSKYEDLARLSPNTQYGNGARHWVTEFCQKESIRDCLTDLKDRDIVFIGDCDEIWNPESMSAKKFIVTDEGKYREGMTFPIKLQLIVYSYFLNNKSSEEFYGTIMSNYRDIKDEVLNHIRSTKATKYAGGRNGWHFTSMGGHERVKQKLTDSYTEDSYANPQVINNLEVNIKEGKDFLGRDFTYTIDESNWPQYLKDNRDRYNKLLIL